MGEISLKALYLPMNSLMPLSVFQQGLSSSHDITFCAPFPSTQPIREGLSLLTNEGWLFHPELPFWSAPILKNPV